MKTRVTLLLASLIAMGSLAQSGIHYKAVIKDNNGNIVANQDITVEFTILENLALDTVYKETHTPTTNDNGLIMLIIGQGTTTNNFNAIEWSNGELFLNVKINIDGGLIDLGITEFQFVPYAYVSEKAIDVKNIPGLEAIDEGNGQGWRLAGVATNGDEGYGAIGEGAIDLSVSDANGATTLFPYGATGSNSIAAGTGIVAVGNGSVAFGENNFSIGDHSFTAGISNYVTGLNSFAYGSGNTVSASSSAAFGSENLLENSGGMYAFGYGNEVVASSRSVAFGFNNDITNSASSFTAGTGNTIDNSGAAIGATNLVSGVRAMAIGSANNAEGDYSFVANQNSEALRLHAVAFGHYSRAQGRNSFAAGRYAIAISGYETVFGSYNTLYNGTSAGWNPSDRLFVIGNGTSNSNRSNAVTVIKNGNTGIGTATPQERLHIANGRLRIGTETIEDGGSDALRFNASLLPDNNNVMSLGNPSLRWTTLYATNGSINTSDRREKKNIEALDYGLSEVLQMNPVSFNWKDKNNPDTKLGLIAQDLLKLVPEVVKTHEWKRASEDEHRSLTKVSIDRFGVYYSDLIPVLINAIKEQQKIINTQHTKIDAIEMKLNALLNINKKEKTHINAIN